MEDGSLLPASWTNSGSRGSLLSSWTESVSPTGTFRTSSVSVSTASMPTILYCKQEEFHGNVYCFTVSDGRWNLNRDKIPTNIHLFLYDFFFANSELLMQKQINQNKFPTDNAEPSRAGPQENLSVKKHQ